MESVIPGWSISWFIVSSEIGINTPQLLQRYAVSEENSLLAANFVPFWFCLVNKSVAISTSSLCVTAFRYAMMVTFHFIALFPKSPLEI
jgi:hypothetical protein